MIGASEIKKRKSTLKRAKPLIEQAPTPESNSGVDTADYTGGSCTGGEGTGECTGDSGFGDVRPFLKVISQPTAPRSKPAGAEPSSAAEYYKTLGTPDSVEGYTTVTRGNSSAGQAGG